MEPGQDLVCTFTNTRDTGIIEVHKRVDDGSGTYQLGDSEANEIGFRWTLDNGVEQTMGSSTSATTGDKHDINENTISGYVFTGWYETWVEIFSCENPESTSLPVSLTVTQNQRRSITLCNQQQNPILTISKSNNKIGIDQSPGNDVLYTITVTATQSGVKNVKVTDLLPDGFKYRAGSWTASSNLNPGLVVSEPNYASPGVWNLGNMQIGEIITLTYIADIDSGQQPGLYRDVAWAAGTSLTSTQVLANAQDPGFVDDNFVGTEVNVVKEQQGGISVNIESQQQGEVLGAATVLPATGSKTIWVIIAGIFLALGLNLALAGYIIRRKYA